jgi:rhamnose transport system ATP-binding protein
VLPLLSLQSISKAFGGTPALREVSLTIEAGEALGLIGENGAGKSTLIKILSGVHQPDAGEILWNGEATKFSGPIAALRAGIATIHQELAYFENLTVAENLMLGERWPRHWWGGTDWTALNAEARRRLKACELKLDPRAMFYTLSPAQRQEVAIARSLAHRAKLLILDEPTASLTEPEVERLFGHLARLKAAGVAILYVSHRLDEILNLTNRVVVLRDGARVAEYPTAEATISRMVRDMVGRELASQPAHATEARERGEVIFRAENITREPLFRNISLAVHRGEIVGLAGLVGAGRSELARAIYGLYAPDEGTMTLGEQTFALSHPGEARERGVVYIPEERKRQGLVLDHSTASAVSMGFLKSISTLGVVAGKTEGQRVEHAVGRFGIKPAEPERAVGTLSGGNQQKALLARWLETDPQFVILDEPTRGVDVGAKAEIHRLIRELAEQGKGVLLISSDLPELLALSDRVVVVHSGEMAAEFAAEEATQEKVLLAASGFEAGV